MEKGVNDPAKRMTVVLSDDSSKIKVISPAGEELQFISKATLATDLNIGVNVLTLEVLNPIIKLVATDL